MISKITGLLEVKKQTAVDKKQKYKTPIAKTLSNQTFLPYNNSYAIAFLGKKDYTQNEKNFAAYKAQLSKKFHKLGVASSGACWDFYINSTPENNARYAETYSNRMKLSSDPNVYQKLLQMQADGVSDKNLKESLDDLVKDYRETVANVADIEAMQNKVNNIGQKFNSSRAIVDGKPVSNAEVSQMMETERDVEKRKLLYYESEVKPADLIADDLVDLVQDRNRYAQKLGFPNYFSYQLKEQYKLDEKEFFKLLADLDEVTEAPYKKIRAASDKELANAYGIEPKDLRPHHYGLLLEGSPYLEADKYVTDKDKVVSTAINMYKRMGWDVPKLPILLDLFPKENKNQHGFCFDIDTNKDVRILANLTNNVGSIETLNHELGHAVYDLGISSHLQYFQRNPASSALTESVAMLMESLPLREATFVKDLDMPKELLDKLEEKREKSLVRFVRRYLQFINFEKQMYENPGQDLKKLWYEMEHKFLGSNIPEKLDNNWASVPHFLTHPVYLQNYLRAEIMAAQIYDAATQKLGKLTENPKTADYFRQKLFRFGSSLEDGEIIQKLSGKKLGTEAFLKQIQHLKF